MSDQQSITRLLSDLVAINSVNPMGRPGREFTGDGMLDYVQSYLADFGVIAQRQPAGGPWYNLVAVVEGPAGSPSIAFDAHSDTVPADDWADRAFTPRVDGGRLYGRGSCDTKASMTAMLTALRAAYTAGRLACTVVLLISADEENGRSGVRAFLESRPRVDAAIVGEPTACRPVIACKGAARWQMTVRGTSAHTSTPRLGVNAIARMAELVAAMSRYEAQVLAAQAHPLVEPATLTPSIIAGGTAVNVVPDSCTVTVDLRTMPTEDPAAARQRAVDWLAGQLPFAVEHATPMLWNGAFTPADHTLTRQVLACRRAAGLPEAVPEGVNYGCHASDFGAADIPAVIIGPGDIKVAHTVDECVELADVARAAAVYEHIMTTPMEG